MPFLLAQLPKKETLLRPRNLPLNKTRRPQRPLKALELMLRAIATLRASPTCTAASIPASLLLLRVMLVLLLNLRTIPDLLLKASAMKRTKSRTKKTIKTRARKTKREPKKKKSLCPGKNTTNISH
jgi:hypothetical protein